MSTDVSLYFVPAGTIERENTADYTEEWMAQVVNQPHYLQQHSLPENAEVLYHVRLCDPAWAVCPNQRWQNIVGWVLTDLRNMSGLTIDESVIEQALMFYAVLTSLVADPDTNLKEFERLLEQYKGQEFYIS